MNGPILNPDQMFQQIIRNLQSLEEMSKCSCQRSQSTLSKQLFLTIALNVSYLEQLSKTEKSEQEEHKQKMWNAEHEREKVIQQRKGLENEIKELKQTNLNCLDEMSTIKREANKLRDQIKDFKRKD